jgi:hypothetical protein
VMIGTNEKALGGSLAGTAIEQVLNRSNLLPHMAQLDGLKAFAAIGVLVQHSMPIHSCPL